MRGKTRDIKGISNLTRNKCPNNIKLLNMAVFTALTAFSGGGTVFAADSLPISVPEGTVKDTTNVNASGQSIKSGINVQGTANTINATFTSGTLNVLGSDDYGYSAILSEAGGVINNLNATITGTNVTVNGGKALSGALIKSMNKITAINADISGTTISGNGSVTGGLVSVESIGQIGSITGQGFKNNTLTVTSNADVTGGVLYNQGALGSITNTTFSGNTVQAVSGNINGGAFANVSNMSGNISGVGFTGNKITSTSGNANGGALYNTGVIGGKIINSTFTDNTATATKGTAHGGAIYTTTDLYISADGATSKFQNNKVVDSKGTRNEGIYVDSRIARLTLETLNRGNILIYDDVDGGEGYNITINGDSAGKVGLYGNITNASFNVSGGNVDFVNSKTTDFTFGQFNSVSGAKYSVDLNVSTGKADNFTVGTGSSGLITINSLNILGDLPDESKQIKILNTEATNNIGITLTQAAINNFNRTETRNVTWSDEVPANMSFGDLLYSHQRNDTVNKTISTVASVYGGLIDSLQYTVTTTQGATTSSVMGDTLRLMNQANSSGVRSFTANTSRNLHTVTEDLGSTGTGTFNVVGVRDDAHNEITTQIDANGHTLFNIDKASTLTLSDVRISNAKDVAGSILNITNPNAVVTLDHVDIDNTNGANGIINNGTLNINSRSYYTDSDTDNSSLYTSISGSGTLNVTGKCTYFHGDIEQEIVNVSGYLAIYNGNSINASSINITGSMDSYGAILNAPIVNNGSLYLNGSNINYPITGTGSLRLYGNITANAKVGNPISFYPSAGHVLNISPDNIGCKITQYGTSTSDRSTVNLVGDGTINYTIGGNQYGRLNINGNVVSNAQLYSQKYIASGATLTIDAGKYTGSGWGYLADQNNGTIIFTGGRLTSPWGIQGSGTIRIRGNVDLHTDTSLQAGHYFTNNIIIEETGTLTSVGPYFVDRTITNNGIFNLAAGTLTRPVTGTGTTNITGPVTMNANLASANIDVKNGATLNINANNIGGTLNNDGSLMVTGGTVAREIHGAGTTRFTGSTTINALVDQTMYSNASITVTVNRADYLGANISGSDNTMYLGSGTLNHTINNFRIYTANNANIVFGDKGQIYGYFYTQGANASVTLKANQLGHTLGIWGGNVYLTGGSFNTNISGGGRLNITGTVTRTGGQQSAPMTITDTGNFTGTITNVFTGAITNNGIFNMAGTLNRNIAGTGTTKINGTTPLVFTKGAGISGIFDFNGGTLNTEDKTILDYSIGKVTGTGNWSLNFDATSGKSDSFTLSQASNAVITPDITLLNVGTTFQNKVFQIFKGKSGPTLNLGTGTKTVNLLNREEDFVTKADVYFNDTYEIRDKTGTGSATLSLATTDNANDSIKMSLNSINWGDTVHTRKDLFHDWLNYSAPVKNFNFRAATDVFNAIDGLYDAAITTTVNVNGVINGATRSKLDFGSKYVGFRIGNGGKLTFSNVEINRLGTQGIDRTWLQINSGGWATFNNIKYNAGWNISYHIKNNGGTIDNISGEIVGANGGYGVRNISGGKINNISAIFRNNSRWGNDLRNEGNAVIGTLDSSIFQDSGCGVNGSNSDFTIYNVGTITNFTNTQLNRNYASGSTAGTISGAGLTNGNIITNFTGNTFDGNNIRVGSASVLSIGRGAAIYNTGKFTNGILDSTFTGNYINTAGGYGAAIYNSGTIKVIDNSTFTGNYIKYNPNASSGSGGAIYGYIAEGIKNSTFDGNYINVHKTSDVANAGWGASGGAINTGSSNLQYIENSNFLNNYIKNEGTVASANTYGGAISGKVHIKGGLFDNNYISGGGSYVEGGAAYLEGGSIIDGTKFTNNHSSRNGGALYGSNATIDGIFEGNYAGNMGGAIYTRGNATIKGTYKGNHANVGGAFAPDWEASIPLITAIFEGNWANYGGAISNNQGAPTRNGVINKITGSTFKGNYAAQQGGAIYNANVKIKEISDSTFTGNYVTGGRDVYGGAIYATGYGITGGIYNSIFRDNYVNGTNTSRGGAIYTNQNLLINANNSGLTEFTGNYVQLNGGAKNYQAIYFNPDNPETNVLTLQANTQGTLLFNDYITGASRFKTAITGDGTGKLKLFNNIYNSRITAKNIYFDTANSSIFNYDFLEFNTADTVKYKLDLNMADGSADNFTLGYGSTGVMTIDDINFMGTANQNRTFQIIKNKSGANTELAFSKTKYGSYNVVDNFLESAVPDTVYNDGDYRQQIGIILGTTNTYHDSIQYIANETRYDPLTIIVGKETDNARSLIFRNNNGITLGSDLGNVTAGTLSIVGTAAKNTINANGHKLFNLANETNFTVSNINLTGADDIITVSNAYTIVNLNNTNVTGNIKGTTNFKLNLGGDSNRINGVVSNATTTLNSGTLTFNRNTFSDSGKLVVNGGAIDFRNDNVENFVINDLSSNASARYNLDINLNDFTSDTITIKNGSASGVVTVDDVNYLGNLTLADIGKHPIKVLNTTSSAITLALSDEVKAKSFVLGDIRRDEQDTVAMVTNFDTVYYNYYRLGNVVGKLSVSSDSPDSITINAIDEWNSNRVATSVLGDTLELVAKSDLAVRILQANKSTDAYNVGSDIGAVTKGELVISGVNDGVESSTINLANHRGFVLGKDTSLSINSAKIIGSDTPIEITDSSARVELNDAYLSGGIKSNVSYDLSLIGNGTTIVNGSLTNAQATLSRGGFVFNKDTFAGANTSLKVDGGSVLMNNGEIEEYVFNNLISNAGASYSIDVDLANAKGDTFNIKSGSGVISIDSFTVSGDLIEANHDYNIKILKANGNPVTLAISDALLSQLKDDFKLGACITTEYETLNPITSWNTIYHKDETTHDILGRFKLNDAKDSIVVTPKNIIALGTQTLVWDDTLKLWSQLEANSAKQFNFDAASNIYKVTANLGASSAGTLSVNGAGSGASLSTINADGNTLFELPNNTTLNLSKVKITNGRNAAGSILNLTNSNAKININNVIIDSTGGSNGINNAGTLTFTGGTNTINTGISGTSGVLNINNGAVVNFGANSNITQSNVNVSNGSLLLDVSDIVYGNVTIGQSGRVTMSGSAITQALSNAGSLNLLPGTLAFAINGDGSTTVSGDVTSRAAINQAITVATDGSLTISASNIGGDVSNTHSLILTGGELAKQVSGSGKTTIRGNVSANSAINQAIDITSEGALTTNASNIGGVVTNARELNLISGTLNKNVSGDGRTNIDGNVTVNSSITGNSIHLNSGVLSLTKTSSISGATQLNIHDGAINLQDNSANNTNLGNVVLNGDLNLSIDAALGTKTADMISATSLSNADNHSIIITSIKVISDTTDSLPIEILVADNILRGAIKLSSEVISVQGANTKNNYLVTYAKDNGKLTFAYGSLSTAITLTTADRQYNLAADETSSLGTESGDGSTLTVNGNNHKITVSSGGQWVIGSNRTVNLNDVTVQNADTTAIKNSGNLNLKNVTLKNNTNDIENSGALTLTGTNVLDNMSGNGNTTVSSGQTTVNTALTQNSLTVNASTTLKNNGTVQASITNAGTIDNTSSLLVKGGSNSGTINGTGTTTVDGAFTNSGSLTQTVVVNSAKTLTNTGTVTGVVTNKGTIDNSNALNISGGENSGTIKGTGTTTLSGDFINSNTLTQGTIVVNIGKTLTNTGTVTGSVTNSGILANNRTLTLTGGSNSGTINGTGTTTVDGAFTNSGSLTQTVVVNSGKTLTNTGTVAGSVTNSGTLANNRTLTLTGGSNAGIINGTGTTTVDGAFTNSGSLTQTVVVNSGKTLTNTGTVTGSVTNSGTLANNQTLTLTGGSNAGTINGTGTTTVDGAFTNSGSLTQAVVVNSGKTLINSGTVAGSVTNSGTLANNKTLTLTGGSNAGTINGTGTTTVDGAFTNSGFLTQAVVVNSGKTLTNTGTVTGVVTNKGTIDNSNALNISGGENTGTINGSGTATIAGDFTNSNILTQAIVVNSGKILTNTGTVTGSVTNKGTITNTNTLNINTGINQGTTNNNAGATVTAKDVTNEVNAVISNSGSLVLNGGTNSGTINGVGTTTVTGNYTNDSTITQGTVAVNNGVTLTNTREITAAIDNAGTISNAGTLALNGGSNSGTINGTGSTVVNENLANSGEITQNNLTISANKKLTNAQAGNITVNTTLANNSEIANDGTLTLKGTNNTGIITGSGTLNAQGTITVNKAITQGNVNIAGASKLTNTAGITSNITNDGTFDNNALMSGNLTNKGSASSSASNLAGNVNNTGSLLLEGGTYGNYTITGTGSTVISENLTNNGSIEQNDITVNSGKTLTNNSEKTIIANNNFTNSGAISNSGMLSGTNFVNNAGASISNAGTLNYNGGTNSGIINGTGNINFSGNVINNNSITQNTVTNSGTLANNSTITGNITNTSAGTLTSVVDNLVGNISNLGTLNLNGGRTQGSISGNGGTVVVNGDLAVSHNISGNTLTLNSDSSTTLSGGSLNLEGLNANGGSLNAQNNSLDNINLGNVVLNSDLNWSIDADLASKTADTISGSTLTTNGHNIIIDSILVLTDATDDMAFEVNVADEILRSCVKLSGDSIAVAGVKENINYLVTYSNSTGNLTFTYGDLDSALHLTASQRNYTLGSDENITRDLGVMEDGQDVLTINGNNHNIIGNGHNGIIISDGNTLNVNNVAGMTGFVTALENKADGKLNISNTTFTDNEKDILNAGLLTFGGTNSLNILEGTGTTTINNGQTTVNQTFAQNTVEIKSAGSLITKGDFDVVQLTNSGTFNNSGVADVESLTNNTGAFVINSNDLTLHSGTNAGTIEGTGLTTIAGDFTNAGGFTQGTIAVNTGKILTNSGTVTGEVNNKGTIDNSNVLNLTGGTNTGTIKGTGTTTIDGDYNNSNILTQGTIAVNTGKTLTNSGAITGSLNNKGTIDNSNKLVLNGGINEGTIKGSGTTTIVEDFANAGGFTQGTIAVNTGKTLTNSGTVTGTVNNKGTIDNSNALVLTGGTNEGTIKGTGSTTIAEDFANAGGFTQGTIAVNAGKILTNSGTVTGTVNNKGTIDNTKSLVLTGGKNEGTIKGTGTTTIDGDFANDNVLTQALVAVNTGKTLTNIGTITSGLNNKGTIDNSNTLNITGGDNTGTIKGSGITTIDGDFTNSNILNQTLVVNKTLVNSGTVTGDVTNKGTITNSNSLFVTGGENLGIINGSGTITVDGDFANGSDLAQGKITVNLEKTLTNNSTITGALDNKGIIANNKTLNVTGGTNSGTINGEGITNVSGTFVNNSNITQSSLNNSGNLTNTGLITGMITNSQSGNLTSAANNLIGEINNSGTLNLTGGDTQANISGAQGVINVNGNLNVAHNISGNTLNLNSGSATNLTTGTLSLDGTNANGGTLNSQNNQSDTMNLGNIILNQDLGISLDANLSEKWADKFIGNSVAAVGDQNIIINNINILAASSDKMPVSLTVTNDTLKDNVKLDSALKVTKDESVQDSYLISYGKDNGQLKFEYSSLPVAVHSTTEQKVYVMSKDEVISVGDFGEIGGKTLSINGSGHTISGSSGVEGLILESELELSFNDLTYSGFDIGVTNNNGILNITDTKFENNTTDIENNAVLNFYGEDFVTTINGNGTTNVTSYKTADGQVVNAVVTLNEGGNFVQESLNIDSGNKFINNGTVDVDNISNKGILTNNTKLSLSAGTNTGSIIGSGDTEIDGKFTSSGIIDQNTLNVLENAEFSVALDKVNTTGKNISNEGILYALDGANSLKIEGSGRTEVVGDVVNTGIIEQKSVTVAEDGKLTTSLDNLLTDEIINSGALHISDGKIDKNISGTETGVVNMDHSMFVNSTVSGTGVALNDGVVTFGYNANLAHSSNFIVNGGTINLVDNRALDSINLGQKMTMNKDLDLLVDVDLANTTMDKISADSLVGDGFINIKYMNVLSDAKENKTRVEFANEALKNNVKTEVKTLSFSPIWMYGVDYDKSTGEFLFTKGGNGAGGGYHAFNPAVLSSPVATQISGHLTMTQTISEAFEHSDWYFRLPKNDRFARMHGNEYAISTDYNGNLGRLSTNYANEGIWTRPYATFESVNLGGGPKVNVMSYGTIVGGDSDFRKLSHGWAYVSSAYVGYNGSQFNYNGVSTTSNGGMLGMTGTFYKGNFYTALTATAGAGFSETHNMYGKEDITMLMGGIASKSGYNIELNDGKFIIQPNLLMSYSFVGTFNYTNSGGVKIDNDPMHTIQIAPSLRFIGNTKRGWQPYATVGMVWNVMNDTHSTANGIRLPEMSTRPYIEYGVGLQKLWNDNFSAYGQAVMRNGGRTGVALTAGFKWSIGKDSTQTVDKQKVQTPVQEVKELPVSTVRRAPVPKVETQSQNVLQSEGKERKIIKQLSASDCVKFGLTPMSKQNASMSLTARTGIMKEL